jgi:Fur family transcriptional regulator, ferric uptake regulator
MDPMMLQPLADQLQAERGFQVDIAHIALFGLCARCGESR